MSSGIFISYRRLDSKADARSICQRLEKAFGKRKVFIDVDSIRPGDNFQSVLKNNLEKCNIMVVVIGPRWLELLRSSSRHTDSERSHDYVYLEVASALEGKLPIFPVLVDGATMPEAKDLPDDLKPLAFRQAFSVTR
jgi:TIR domain